VIKPTAVAKHLWKHCGPAVVFDDIVDLKSRIDSDDLEVTKDSILVLRNAGPVGAPGMPEWGQLPIPKKLLVQGVQDMVRISDARMSGTSYGACVLHVAPEAAIGGPLAFVRTGDIIELDINARRIDLHVNEDELTQRRKAWHKPKIKHTRGYASMYIRNVNQADAGCDFDFMAGAPGETPEPDIF
jgi:dihydroxy-acid dehydratase